MNSLLIDLSYASSRLEDVRISWRGTKTLIELGERPAGLTDREHRRQRLPTDVFEDAYAKGAPRYVEIMRVLHGGNTLGSVSPMGHAR